MLKKSASGWVAILVCATLCRAGGPTAPERAFLESNCLLCHDTAGKEGGLDLESLSHDLDDPEALRRWVRVFERVSTSEMPPEETERPDPGAMKAFLSSLGARLAEADREQREVVYRRLNRVEYENTVRDLFGVRAEVAGMLPEDSSAYGFDNLGEALSVSTELIEAYLRAADVVIDMALSSERPPPRRRTHSTFTAAFRTRSNARLVYRFLDEGVVAYLSDLKSTHVRDYAAAADGTYQVRFRARAYHSDKPIRMEVSGGDVHNRNRGQHTIGYFDANPEITEIVFEDWFREGDGFSVRPFGIGNVRVGKNRKYAGPGLLLIDYDVDGPLDTDLLAGQRELLGAVDLQTATAADARDILTRFLLRAFRRAVTEGEISKFTDFMGPLIVEGQSVEGALRAALRAVLCAPEFLFLNEPLAEDGQHVDDYALASRMSYFLWSTMPDEELLQCAARGELRQVSARRAQVERMLASPKAAAFTENFTGQWLRLREIDLNEPDRQLYPEFDALLQVSMAEETRRFFDEVLRRNLSVTEFVDSDWTILNDRLAGHYGVPGVSGMKFRRVRLPADSARGGLLTQGSILKVTANGTTTSPVLRGVFANENLLGVHVPPPPPVPAVEPDLTGATTLRQQLAEHRDSASCASCHSKIDPAGFALESFDAIGGWRRRYRVPADEPPPLDERGVALQPTYKLGLAVDSAGTLPSGESFHDIKELKKLLLRDPERVARCVTEKLLTYGLGRSLGFSDREEIDAIVRRARDTGYGFRSLIHEVVASDAFTRP